MISETDVTSYVVTFIRTWNTLLMSLEFFRSIFRPTLSVLFWYSWFLNILVFGKAWFSLRYLNYESYFFLKYNTSTVRSMKIWCIRGQKYGFDSRSCVRGLNSLSLRLKIQQEQNLKFSLRFCLTENWRGGEMQFSGPPGALQQLLAYFFL